MKVCSKCDTQFDSSIKFLEHVGTSEKCKDAVLVDK